jgi:hypothetical protein
LPIGPDLTQLVAGEDRVAADVVDFVLARHGGEVFAPRRIMSAVVPAGGGGSGTAVSRKP